MAEQWALNVKRLWETYDRVQDVLYPPKPQRPDDLGTARATPWWRNAHLNAREIAVIVPLEDEADG